MENKPSRLIYPITITRCNEKSAVVIGGGAVAERKINHLLEAHFSVRVISPGVTPAIRGWRDEGRLTWDQCPYVPGGLSGAFLVFAATDDRNVNAQVADEALSCNILCNVADAPELCTFHVPAVYFGEDVVLAVSTYGNSPKLAKEVRDRLALTLTPSGKS
jgi:cobalt-precorrin 5A hydrolase/precorrin-3B C17-methyltransferase